MTLQVQGNAVLFSYDYYSNASFTVLAQMQQDAVSQILTSSGGGEQEGIVPFDDPFNWNGYIIQYDLGNGLVAFLFSEEANLSAGDSATLGENAAFRSGQFIETSISGGGGGTTQTQDQAGNTTDTQATNETDGSGLTEDDVTVETDDSNETASS